MTTHDALSNARSLSEEEAIAAFDLRDKLERYGAGGRQPGKNATVLVVPGPLHVLGDLLVDWRKDFGAAAGLVVEGNLMVDGAIVNTNLNDGPFLLVQGATQARTLYAGGAEFRFEGASTFSDAVIGCYNDGYTRFVGDVQAPIVIAEDHAFDFQGKSPPYFDPFNGDGDVEDWSFLCADVCPDADRSDPSAIDVERDLLPLVLGGQRIATARE